jgi:CHASE2 domain-containing sensor protein
MLASSRRGSGPQPDGAGATIVTEQQVQARRRVGRVIERARRPDREQMTALRDRVPLWFVFLVLLSFAFIQIELNPFGLSDLIQRYAQDVSNLLITGPYFYGTAGRDSISAAVIDEDTLQTLKMPWPWDYGAHARVLDALLEYHPKAVVVDFLFVDSRPDPTLPQLIEEIHRYQREHVPIYFEGGIHLPYGEAALRPELAATGVTILDPTLPVYNGIARQYNITGECFGSLRPHDEPCLSLALRVFKDIYPQYPLAALHGMMELVWGTSVAPQNAKWITATESSGARKSCRFDVGPLRRIYLAFFDTAAVQNPCPYNAEIPVVSLMEGSDDPDLVALARNRVIFYGGALQGAQDETYTPVNGLLPSVFVHAMALDNLITYKGRPKQNVVTVWGRTLASNPAQIIAIMPVILVLSLLHVRRVRARGARQSTHARSAPMEYVIDRVIEHLWHFLAFGLGLAVGLLLTLALGLSVANWVEVVFVSAELAAMLLVGLPDSIWGYLSHVAREAP